MPSLRIRRGADTAGIFMPITVQLDGTTVAMLRPLQHNEISVDAGDHELVATMSGDGSESLRVTVRPSEDVALVVKVTWSAFRSVLRAKPDMRGGGKSGALVIRRE
jgi:hypothetical protein